VIESRANENLLSVVSPWVIAIKTSIGKLRLTGPFGDIVSRAMNDVSVTIVSADECFDAYGTQRLVEVDDPATIQLKKT
jgi:PIN domain nuclease of toxin-antitoxin system